MELKKITDQVYYIPSIVNLGIIKDEDASIILIDSGIDSGVGKKIQKLLTQENLPLKAIINTHSHADHCGGNKYLQKVTGAEVYAPEIEDTIIRNPFLEPWYLFSGANPIKDLQNKFLMAPPSNVDHIIKKTEERLTISNVELGILPLPGHALNQLGIVFDDVCFCADSIFSIQVLEKHRVPFFIDIEKTLDTLNFLLTTDFSFYVPAHADPSPDITDVIKRNIECIKGIESVISDILLEPKTTDQLLKDVADNFQLTISQVNQYFLLKTPMLAYLSYLRNRKKIQIKLSSNELIWYREDFVT